MRTRRVCALLGIDLGIGGAIRDSNFSAIQLSVLDENELNDCINTGLEHWFQSNFQVSLFHTHTLTVSLSLSLSHEAPYFLFYRATLVNAIFIMIVFLNVKFRSGFAIKVVLYRESS